MNIKAYIESGALENYVLGLVTEQERHEVEQHAKQHEEIRAELRAIEISLEQYAVGREVVPPAALKESIWQAVNKSSANAEAVDGKIISINRETQTTDYSKWLAAASIVLLVGSSLLNLFLFNQWTSVSDELAAVVSEKDVLANQFQTQQAAFEKTQQEFAFMILPGTKTISLKGVEAFPQALATVYWNNNSQEVYINASNLPSPPADKQYQLWAIVDGQPVDAGVFDIGSETAAMQKMKNFTSAQAFAVTLEQRGGSLVPTMEAMYVIGTI